MERKAHYVSCLVCAIVLSAIPFAGSFEVTSSRTLTGIVGQDVVLPCQISTGKQPDNMEVQWKKIIQAHIEVVYGYQPQPGQDGAGPKYQGRAVLLKDGFTSGNVSLKLKNVQPADEGTYSCIVKSNAWSADTTTELRLAAEASVSIDILGPQDQGIGLACRSAGWFPEPKLQWVTKKGPDLKAVTKMDQDREHLFNVLSHVTVLGEETGEIICIIQNRLLKTEQKSIILLSGDIFPRVSPWLTAFWVLFIVNLLAIGVCAYLGYTAKRKMSKRKRSKEETLLMSETEKKALESECEELRQRHDRAVTELDFRKARSYMVPVTLDMSYKQPELTISEDGRTVQHYPTYKESAAPSGTLIAVGREGFVAKKDHGGEGGVFRWYWEVQVGDSLDWELGVLSTTVRATVKEKGLKSLPEEECWALRRSGGSYHPSNAGTVIQSWSAKPTVVGVFLDLEAESVSFYGVDAMDRILEISVGGSKRLFPFLSPGRASGQDQGKPLSICPPSNWDFPQTLKTLEPNCQIEGKGGVNTGTSSTEEKFESKNSPKGFRRLFQKWKRGFKTEEEHLNTEEGNEIQKSQGLKANLQKSNLQKPLMLGKGKQKEKNTQNLNPEGISGTDATIPQTSGTENMTRESNPNTDPLEST